MNIIKYAQNVTTRIVWDLTVNIIASSKLMPNILRYWVYKICGLNIKSYRISPNCFFSGNKVSIGRKTFINYHCFFDNSDSIEIGERCAIGYEVMFCTSTHKIGESQQRANTPYGLPIKVGNGCWIGARSTILAGVTIEHGCVIGSGTVVIKDCKANGLYVGVPAKRIRDLDITNVSQ